MPADPDRLQAGYQKVCRELLAQRNSAGHWEGSLASSALATATAVSALCVVDQQQQQRGGPPTAARQNSRQRQAQLIGSGLDWLTQCQNSDGGFGDTDLSHSNIATTMLVDAAIRLAGQEDRFASLLQRAGEYLDAAGRLAGLRRRYGKDKTFAVPILTNCALAGTARWCEVPALPFEMAVLPSSVLGAMQLPVVSYALPALIAIGQARYHHRKPYNPLLRLARAAALEPSLKVLTKIQPASGGFLEATPLTSFVAMSLAASGQVHHPVTAACVRFLEDSVRPDGSWPIDTNLATWVTTLSINALAETNAPLEELSCWDWVLSCQHRKRHPYTGAAPGGWAWTDLSGGVPDADDTPGALLALAKYRDRLEQLQASSKRAQQQQDQQQQDQQHLDELTEAAGCGVLWLLDLQNNDGGWPTFCRGWGALPFDRSGTDLTAHVIRALATWIGKLQSPSFASPRAQRKYADLDQRMARAIARGLVYLQRKQRADGSWVPLWFGNQDHPEEENPVYGTARVLLAYRDLGRWEDPPAQRGIQWLIDHQNADGGWGGSGLAEWFSALPEQQSATGISSAGGSNAGCSSAGCSSAGGSSGGCSSIEETAVAVQSLAAAPAGSPPRLAAERGLKWLLDQIEQDKHTQCAPIGFYFAKLWYYERLYPIIFAVSALGTALSARGSSRNNSQNTRQAATGQAATGQAATGQVATGQAEFHEETSRRTVTKKDDQRNAATERAQNIAAAGRAN